MGRREDVRSRMSVPPQYREHVEKWIRKAYGGRGRPDELVRLGKQVKDGLETAKGLGMRENSLLRAIYTGDWKGALLLALQAYYDIGSSEQISRVFIEMYISKGGGRSQEKIISWVDEAGDISTKVVWEFGESEEIAQGVKRALMLGMHSAVDALEKREELKHL